MSSYTIALFGEAEKGEYHTPYLCTSLAQLVDHLGNPPAESRGLFFATQVILLQRDLIFLRVKEEGFSTDDYLQGLQILKKATPQTLIALSVPGVGNQEIIQAATLFCHHTHAILLFTEADLYDYLTQAA